MSELVSYEQNDTISTITMDDGKVNAMSVEMLATVHDALDRAEAAGTVVVLTGREGIFSAGFDLKVLRSAAKSSIEMLRSGAELAERVLSFPRPVVTACNGHALPMGAFLLLSADLRIGTRGDFTIGLNEVAIGLTVPCFAVEIARQRLSPAHFDRSVVNATMYSPEEAVVAGYLDRVVPAAELASAAEQGALALAKLDPRAHITTKLRARSEALRRLRDAIDSELSLAQTFAA
jgi:enoyl-CoA hydratase